MDFKLITAYIECMKDYSNFSGRLSKVNFWSFVIANIILSAALGIIFGEDSKAYAIYALFTVIPFWSAVVRRLHDTGQSANILYILIIPFILAINGAVNDGLGNGIELFVVLIFIVAFIIDLSRDGTAGNNKYGEPPK